MYVSRYPKKYTLRLFVADFVIQISEVKYVTLTRYQERNAARYQERNAAHTGISAHATRPHQDVISTYQERNAAHATRNVMRYATRNEIARYQERNTTHATRNVMQHTLPGRNAAHATRNVMQHTLQKRNAAHATRTISAGVEGGAARRGKHNGTNWELLRTADVQTTRTEHLTTADVCGSRITSATPSTPPSHF
ncbi:hypothetical protein J6590_071255 [Homalodisca vitripennis]|nr:hypothetical protein J6590_071255 [Homalodisca vitripennis]